MAENYSDDMKPMTIRDTYAPLNGDESTTTIKSGSLDIVADDGKPLFSMCLIEAGTLELTFGYFCKHGGNELEDIACIFPRAANMIWIRRNRYQPKKGAK